MKKRLLSMILALSMMLTILPVNAITAWAADDESGVCGDGLTYTMIQNDGTDTYTLAITKSGTGTGAMTDYSQYSAPWYVDCLKITKLTIDGATSIGKHAFEGCRNLTDVVISSGVTSIGEGAFKFCEALTNTSISSILKEATSIGDHAFYGCTSLTSVEIPESVTSIGVAAFSGCSNLTSVKILGTITSIAKSTFESCHNLTDVVILSGVTSIGEDAFEFCKALTNTSISSILKEATSIGDHAFYGCTSLTSVEIPESVTSIGVAAFSGCSNLTSVKILGTITSIAASTFIDCGKLNNFDIPVSVTSNGDWAFERCSGLADIEIPEKVTSIGNHAFENCTSLTTIKIPDSVTSIGENAFNGCSSLHHVELPYAIPTISKGAFNNVNTHYYYPGYRSDFVSQAQQKIATGIIGMESPTYSLVHCYSDVSFDANGGSFADGGTQKKVEKIWSATKLTQEQVDSIGMPKQAGKIFLGWNTTSNATTTINPISDYVVDGKIYYAVYRDVVPATIAINNSNKTFKAGTESDAFTVTATKGDTEAAKVKFKFTNGTVQYKNNSTDWTDLTGNEISIDELNSALFRIATNKNATVGTSTLTVELVTEQGTEIGVQNTADFTVTARTPAAVTITGPTNNAVKAGEPSQTFTMSITNHDDAVGKVTFDFDGEVQYADNTYSPNWTTVDKDNGVTRAIATGKYFRVVPKADAATGDMTLTAKLVDTDGNEITGATASTTFAVTARKPAEVTITGLDNTTVKAGEAKEFTVNVTPNDDANTGAKATITVSGANADAVEKIQYKDGETWKDVPGEGLSIDEINNTEFKLITKADANDGDVTITVTANKANGTEIDKKVAAVTVKKHENAAVTIDGLDGTTVKAGEAQDFTVNVTPNDDTIDKVTFGTTSGEVQWSNDGGNTWTTVSGDVDYSDLTGKQFRVVPAADAANGTVTVTVIAKKADGTEAAKKDASFTVTKKEEPVTPGGGSTGGGENPGGNPGSGSTKPEQETPKRKLEIADGTLTSVTVKDKNGNLKDITDTITKDLDGKYEIPVGAKVTITAKDAPEGMKFGEWSISDKTLLGDPDVPYTEKDLIFTMPDNPDGVKLSVVYLEESIGEEPNLLEKGALAGTVVVGSAALLYQGHMLGTELYLRYLLPHGAVIPQNRAELAVLLWQDAENPEPVSTTLYSDISDEDSAIQQAARWAVENDLMEQLDAEEHPDHFDPFVPVTFSDSIRAWKKAQELKKSVH